MGGLFDDVVSMVTAIFRTRRTDVPAHPREGVTDTLLGLGTAAVIVGAGALMYWSPVVWNRFQGLAPFAILGLLLLFQTIRLHTLHSLNRARMSCDRCNATLQDADITVRGLICPMCRFRTSLFPARVAQGPPKQDAAIRLGLITLWHGERHREYPALRRFARETGSRYLAESIEWSQGRLLGARIAAFFVGVLLTVGMMAIMVAVLRSFAGPTAEWLVTPIFLATLAAGILLGLVVGWHLYKGAVSKAIDRRLRADRCGRCDYPFNGVHPAEGLIVCPECGADVPVPVGPAPPERCAGCGYSLAGIPLRNGELLCPECGRSNPLIPTTAATRGPG